MRRTPSLRRRTTIVAAFGVAALALSGCGLSGDALESGGGGNCDAAQKPKDGPIKIGSANFPESSLIAEVYAGALKAKGVNATTTDPIGAREAYLKALSDGSVQLVPEYTNSLLTFLDKDIKVTGTDEIYAGLLTALPCDQLALQKSTAEDSNAMVVPKDVADKWQLKTISDLAKHANEVTIAAPAEFRGRQQGLLGLQSVYNLKPKSFRPLGTPVAIASALKNGQAQAANIFSTDPAITSNGFVVLKDDKALFGSDNVVPLISKSAATPKVQVTLNAVSAKLTTPKLAQMLKLVVVDKKDAKSVAADFLKQEGLA